MRKVAGLVFILFFLKPGLCEWKQVSQSEEGAYYVDPGSVLLIDEGIKSVWVLINFKQENNVIVYCISKTSVDDAIFTV